ncbi:MAG: metallophosphoesterase [Crocinitomicaceae bacterium]
MYFGTVHFNTSTFFSVIMGTTFVFWVTKFVIALFLILEDVIRFIEMMIKSISQKKISKENFSSRRKFVATMAYGVAAIPFFSLMYGILYGKYDFRIHRQKLRTTRIPKAFDGLKIVQLSDMHIGSFDDKDSVQNGFNMVNQLEPDLILFTGDMVNNMANEIEGYEQMLSGLKARIGKYAVLGNHDYGEYINWNSEEERIKNIEDLVEKIENCGFKMLRNENTQIKINGHELDIIGVENWGNKPFPQHGDIDLALKGTKDSTFKILMSHDPDHFEEIVKDHPSFIDLTLSGHTHGSQMGIEIPGFRWSPVQYRYKRWAGRYEEDGQVLYVNRGFGYLGYPGRVGIWPEITEFTLESELA